MKQGGYYKEVTTLGDKAVVILTRDCTVTNKPYKLSLDLERWEHWKAFGLVKTVFPELSDDERTFINEGLTPAEKAAK